MIEHGVGVAHDEVLRVVKGDGDYFEKSRSD